jgi:tetratricopeptide (TPR) repeat protein
MADVFVSYARHDKARVAPLVAAIEASGWSVWWDPEICPGQEFDRQIVAELRIATAVLVVWTPNSVESRWVRGEAREGAERGSLVPVRFERAELPIDVRTFHTTDLDDWSGDPQGRQVQEVIHALGGQDAESYEVIRSAAYLSYRRQRLEDAIRYWEKATTLMETDINSPAMLMSCYVAVRDSGAARRSARIALSRAEKALAQDPSSGAVMAYSAYALATLVEAERAKDRMNRAMLIDPGDWNMRYNFACVLLIHLDEPDVALNVLEPVLENVAAGYYLNHIKVDPDFIRLRDNPRFKAMIAAAAARVAEESYGGPSLRI